MDNTYLVMISAPDDVGPGVLTIKTTVRGKLALQKLISELPEDHELIELANLGYIVDSCEIFEEWAKLSKPSGMEFGNEKEK